MLPPLAAVLLSGIAVQSVLHYGTVLGRSAYLAAAGVDVADHQLAYRQPSAGATWVRMLSMTWAL